MSAKIVTYDLRAPGRDYAKLYDALKACSRWAKVTESCWLVVTADTCELLRNKLMKCMDSNDRLFVAALTGEAAWLNTICSNDELRERLN